ncbi:MAG: hypothetical protein AAF074_05730 [Pseudomonadota bacterium]
MTRIARGRVRRCAGRWLGGVTAMLLVCGIAPPGAAPAEEPARPGIGAAETTRNAGTSAAAAKARAQRLLEQQRAHVAARKAAARSDAEGAAGNGIVTVAEGEGATARRCLGALDPEAETGGDVEIVVRATGPDAAPLPAGCETAAPAPQSAE